MNAAIDTILRRRSIRSYKQEQIKDEELNLILEAGKYAPSAINEQCWHFTVVQNKETLNKINEVCRTAALNSGNKFMAERAKSPEFSIFYNAPSLIIISGEEKAIAPQIDCALALENMFLAAESLDIGSCWIHAVTQIFSTEEGKALKSRLGIPEGYSAFAAGSFGYKSGEQPAAADRKENMVNIVK